MLIVSQNRKKIINLDQIQEIEINTPMDWNQECYSIDTYPLGEGDHHHIRLGKYETSARAEKVLEEIVNKYLELIQISSDDGDVRQVYAKPIVYLMPRV